MPVAIVRRVSQAIVLGDCLDVFHDLRHLDAIVADPPAGIGFMGRKWDKHSPHAAYQPPIPSRSKKHLRDLQERQAFVLYWAERFAAAYDACHDDGVALIWALPKTSDWTAEALRLAGWYVRDVITHLFGQGYPKTPRSLKPASEHWILCSKRPGLMPLDIDACRVDRGGESTARTDSGNQPFKLSRSHKGGARINGGHPLGAHPANLILSHHPDCLRAGERKVKGSAPASGPTLTGPSRSNSRGDMRGRPSAPSYGTAETIAAYHCAAGCECGKTWLAESGGKAPECECGRAGFWACPVAELDGQSAGSGDEGGASRFFNTFHYFAKAPGGERHAGCENLYWRANPKSLFQFDRVTREEFDRLDGDPWIGTSSGQDNREGRQQKGDRAQGNVHPTVKSIALMRWLHALTGAKRIGDLCAGSGSGAIAAYLDGIEWIGAEVCPEAIEIAEARLAFWRGCTPDALARFCEAGEVPQRAKTDPRQVSMFGE